MEQRLYHQLNPFFEDLAQACSTPDLEKSSVYQKLKDEIEALMKNHEFGEFSDCTAEKPTYKAAAWNIERGIHLDQIIEFMKNHPALNQADVCLLTETDIGMARSGNRNVAREIAEKLGFNYFFAPSYLNLCKGVGHEAEFAGENTLALHGNAILSRYPIVRREVIELPNGKDKMRGREKRIGCQKALVADIEFPQGKLSTACIHLDAHSTRKHRATQMQCILEKVTCLPKEQPVLMGGDWNTTTYNSHRALHAIVGFWVRVAIGVDNMINNHYVHPDRFWEKRLFQGLEKAGFDYKSWNIPGIGTLTYDIRDIKQYKNLGDWIPQWCFRFIEWSLRNHNGICPFKLDWFSARGLKPINPRVLPPVANNMPVSDHAAIVTDFAF